MAKEIGSLAGILGVIAGLVVWLLWSNLALAIIVFVVVSILAIVFLLKISKT